MSIFSTSVLYSIRHSTQMSFHFLIAHRFCNTNVQKSEQRTRGPCPLLQRSKRVDRLLTQHSLCLILAVTFTGIKGACEKLNLYCSHRLIIYRQQISPTLPQVRHTVILFSSRYLFPAKSICHTCEQAIQIFMQIRAAGPPNRKLRHILV